MKKFKEFIKSKKSSKPTLITAQPVHGAHATEKKKLKEATGPHGPLHQHGHVSWGQWVNHNDNHHLGEHPLDVHERLNHSKEHFKTIPGAQEAHDYTDNSSITNRELIDKARGKKPSYEHNEHDAPRVQESKKWKKDWHEKRVKGMDEAIKHHPLEHDIHVYHGTSAFNPGEEAAKHKGGIHISHDGKPRKTEGNKIHLPAYTSTSLDKNTAQGFAGTGEGTHIIHVHMKKGQHGLYMGKNSHHDCEKEMILPRDTKLKIHPKPSRLSNGTHVWHAHISDD